ncbi:MAG: hypothetical protein IJZ96_05480 [Lachnospiraceae bacterium]|nr:hypothetical protein [Lachnospiraceae bacterium]
MKVTKKLLHKCYAFGMVCAMTMGLCATPAVTALAEESEEIVEIGGGDSWYNEDLYDSREEAIADTADIMEENQEADVADGFITDEGKLVDIPKFSDPNEAADYMRKCFVERRSKFEFEYVVGTYYTEAYGEMLAEDSIEEIEELVFEETPESDEGDYLYWHTAEYYYEYSGYTTTDTVSYVITPSYLSTAAQEAEVTNKINSILETDLDGWENHTDTSNACDAFWWLIYNFDLTEVEDYEDLTAYNGFINGIAMQPGYATAAYRLLKEMGISNRVVYSRYDDEPHMWNIVGIDGEYYNFDAFYGDVTDSLFGGVYPENYFLVSDDFLIDSDNSFDNSCDKIMGKDSDLYNSNNHRKVYDYCRNSFEEIYQPANGDFLMYDPSTEYETIVTNPDVGVTYRTHVQREGWQAWKSNGDMSGTSGKSLRLEGIEIDLTGDTGLDIGIEYKTHIQSYGWESEWNQNGEMSGTSGESKRLEAIKIRLTGSDAALYDIYYRVHAQNYGWLGWAKNGEEAGTAGQSKRLEGIEIKVVKKGQVPSGLVGYSYIEYGKSAELNSDITGLVNYRTHVQNYGWQGYVYDGSLSGTYGESKRLEGIEISLGNTGYSGGITYRTHIQKIGWQDCMSDGDMSGTSGQSLRLEAIEIKLTGEVEKHYDVYYRVHAQTYGWLGWAKNGESAGTAGYGKRLESIQIVLVPKGGTSPGDTTSPFVSK